MVKRFGRTRIVLALLALCGLASALIVDPSGPSDVLSAITDATPDQRLALVSAGILVLVGQVLRALRTQLVINQAYKGPFSAHFGALSIGYFVNTFAPLRVGELLRAWLLARKLRISLLYTFLVIALERLFDVVFVAAVYLAVSLSHPGALPAASAAFAATLVVVSAIGIVVIVLVVSGQQRTRRYVGAALSWLAPHVRDRVQYSIWSTVYGFHRFAARRALVAAYFGLLIASWGVLLLATYVLTAAYLPEFAPGDAGWLSGIFGPFVSASGTLGWPSISAFLDGIEATLNSFGIPASVVSEFGYAAWISTILPIAAIGFVWSFFYTVRSIRSSAAVAGEVPDPGNKLERVHDNPALSGLTDAWFRGEELAHVIHELEVSGGLSLVHVFKGGSNALTVLSQHNGAQEVRKIVPAAYESKLRMQRDWLAEASDDERIVRLLGDERGDGYYTIALEYRESTVPLFEYIHQAPLETSAQLLRELWDHVERRVHAPAAARFHSDRLDEYVADRLEQRLEESSRAHELIAEAARRETIVINGQEHLNLRAALAEIRSDAKTWEQLAWMRTSPRIHGDLTIDNVLVDRDTDRFLIIDPSDDNQLSGPVLDAARLVQSLAYGYEFLNADSDPVLLGRRSDGTSSISFHDGRSAQYERLRQIMVDEVFAERLEPEEFESLDFHAGLFYARMLSHRVVIDPANALKYYATSVIGFNRYLERDTRS